MVISDSEIIAELTGAKPGPGIEDYFVVGYDIRAIYDGKVGSLLVEDEQGEEPGEMHFAILDFLRRRGAKFYESDKEYFEQRHAP